MVHKSLSTIYRSSAAMFALLAPIALGQVPAPCERTEVQVLTTSGAVTSQEFEGFGASVAGTSSFLAVGYPADESGVNLPIVANGSVRVYDRMASTWVAGPTLAHPNINTYQSNGSEFNVRYGWDVDAHGDFFIVGCNARQIFDVNTFFSVQPPAVVYRRIGSTWQSSVLPLPADLQPSPTSAIPPSRFATAVTIASDVAVVGEPGYTNPSNEQEIGRIHIYERSGATWSLVASIVNPDPEEFANFGHSVGVSNGVVVVGAPGAIETGTGAMLESGVVYVFSKTGATWQLVTQLEPRPINGARDGMRFGEAVDIDFDGTSYTVAVGASYFGAAGGVVDPFNESPEFRRTGDAFVYGGQSSLSLSLETVVNDNAAISSTRSRFGTTVAVSGDFIAIGRSVPPQNALCDPFSGCASGAGLASSSAFLVTRSGTGQPWSMGAAFTASPLTSPAEYFSNGLAIAGSRLVLGDPEAVAESGVDNGVFYDYDLTSVQLVDCDLDGQEDQCQFFFDVDNVDCNGNGVIDACDIAAGTSSDLDGNGVPDECDPDCNGNGIPDVLDISSGTSDDVDGNGIPDECSFADVVVIVDNSGSVGSEAFSSILEFRDELFQDPQVARVTLYTIDGPLQPGADGVVFTIFGNQVPCADGSIGNQCDGCDELDLESWGPATAIVAQFYGWQDGATKIIVSVSDETACSGGAYFPESDGASMQNASDVCNANCVTWYAVFPQGGEQLVGNWEIAEGDSPGIPFVVGTDFANDGDIPAVASLISNEIALGNPLPPDCKGGGCGCPGDANSDGGVDLADLNLILGAFGTAVDKCSGGDVTGDGVVDLADLNLVLAQFGTQCGVATSSFAMSMTDPDEVPVTIWLLLKDYPSAAAWLEQLEMFTPAEQAEDADDLKEWVDDWEAGSPE